MEMYVHFTKKDFLISSFYFMDQIDVTESTGKVIAAIFLSIKYGNRDFRRKNEPVFE